MTDLENIKDGYFMYRGLIVHVKILSTPRLAESSYSRINIDDNKRYEYINFENAGYYLVNYKIDYCEDIKGRSKGIQSVKKNIQNIINNNYNEFIFRCNKQIVIDECVDYIFHKEPKKFKTAKYTHSGIVKLYDEYGNVKEEYFNNNGIYEGVRKKYKLYWKRITDNVYDFVKSYCEYEYNYINGKLNGIHIKYTPYNIEYEYTYEDDKRNGLQIRYFDGRKTTEYYCINDKIEGEYLEYYYNNDNSITITKQFYQNGRFIKYI